MTVQTMGRRERKKQAVREKIAEETIALIRRQGVDGVTVEAICERADIAKKTFYNYYSSRHELMNEICNSTIQSLIHGMIDHAMTEGRVLEEQLDILFAILKKSYTRADRLEKELIDYMVSEFPNHRSQSVYQLDFTHKGYVRLFEHNAHRLKPFLEPVFCAEITVAMVNGLTLNWLNDDAYDIEQRLDTLKEYLTDSFLIQASS